MKKVSTPRPQRVGPRAWLWVSAAVYFLTVIILNALQIKALAFTKGVDQTYLFESLASTVDGQFFVHSHAITNLGGWGLMDHFWPSMLLLVPFIAVFENILSLYIINAACLTVTGLVLARLARQLVNNEAVALLAALVFWTMPEAYAFAITGNWPEIWAMPFFALLFLFYFEDRPRAFAIAAILFMGCMEQMLGYVAIFSGIELLRQRRWRWLILPLALAALWVAIIAVMTPDSSTGRFFTHAFAIDGPRILDFLKRLFFDIDRSPLLYLSLLWPPSLVFALPPMVIVTGWGLDFTLIPKNDGALRYAFFIFFVMAIGGLRGLGTFSKFLEPRVKRPAAQIATAFLCLALAIHALTFSRMWPRERSRFLPSDAALHVWKVLETLPTDARVIANREIPYAFVGRVDAFVGFFNTPFFSIQEFYFDHRNQPIPPWTGVEKFHAMGRHTPSAIVLENSSGIFRPVAALWAGKGFPYRQVRCIETTQDGHLDILMGSADGRALVFRADPTHSLTFRNPVPTDPHETPEILEHNLHSSHLRAYGGLGQTIQIAPDHRHLLIFSNDQNAAPIQAISVDGFLEEVTAGDLDGDGANEIFVVDSQRYLIRIYGRGNDGSWAEQETVPAPPIPTSLAVADLDADGDLDLVITKSQLPTGVEAFARLVDHEGIDHIFWFDNPLQERLRQHYGRSGWSIEEEGDLVYMTRPNPEGSNQLESLRGAVR